MAENASPPGWVPTKGLPSLFRGGESRQGGGKPVK